MMIKLNTEKLWDCYSHRQIIIVVTDRALYICGVLFFTLTTFLRSLRCSYLEYY